MLNRRGPACDRSAVNRNRDRSLRRHEHVPAERHRVVRAEQEHIQWRRRRRKDSVAVLVGELEDHAILI